MSSSECPPEISESFGRIVIQNNDLEAITFWIRVFGLQPHVNFAQAKIIANPRANWASVPIISEHTCGRLHWSYVIVLDIDTLGVQGGLGVIFVGDGKNATKARRQRDDIADSLMETFKKRVEAGGFHVETEIIEPGGEPS